LIPDGHALLEAIKPRRQELIESLRALVEHESPSLDKTALDGLARTIAARLQTLGGRVELVPNTIGGEHVLARFGPESEAKPALVIGHYDTVWPIGTLATMPFQVEGVRASGPGIYDMKASLVLIEAALGAIATTNQVMPRPLVVLFTSDEEIGSLRSRDLIEDQAKKCAYTLVVEPPLTTGALKTSRKGTGIFNLAIEGRAAHAGVEPEKGRSAIVELAHQILAIEKIQRPELGTTLNVGIVHGGFAGNVVPAHATAMIDARITSMTEAARVESEIKGLKPVLPDVTLTVTGRIKRPPMERTPAVAALFERARPIGQTLGLDLKEGSTGGASDGNFTAALGVPTLDGLGCPGSGAHAIDEHILIDGLLERAALLAALLLGL
jgi:glutamate carboxypeptidase